MKKFYDLRFDEIFASFSKAEQPLVKFFLLLRLLQQTNQFVYKNPATGLTILESSLLLEIDARETTEADSLCRLFNVEQSTLSRNLARIRNKNLILIKPSSKDARRQEISLSTKSKDLLKKHDILSNRIVSTYLSRISSSEYESILRLFKSVCDECSIVSGISRKNERPIRTQMRRLGYLLGLTRNENFMSSHLTMLGWQTLFEIYTNGEIHSIKTFAQKFNIPAPNLTQQITSLEKLGLITKIQSEYDKREVRFTYTKKGFDELSLIIKNATKFFGKKLSRLTKNQITKIIPSLEKMISKSVFGNYLIHEDLSLYLCRTPTHLSQARTFIITKLFEKNQISTLSSDIASPHNKVICILKNDEILGVVEFTSREEMTVVNEALSSKIYLTKAALLSHVRKFILIG